MKEQEIEKLVQLNRADFEYREWLPLKYARDWAVLNGEAPQGDYVADYHSHYSGDERAYIHKIMGMMRFMNSLGNTLAPKSRREGTSAACVIENRDYSRNKSETRQEKDHADVAASPPFILIVVLAAGLLLNKIFPLGIQGEPGVVTRTIGILLFVVAGIIQVPTVMLMLRHKTTLRPDRKTTTIVTNGLFRYSRNPLYLSLMMIFCGIAFFYKLLWLFILLPVLFFALERWVVCREEEYLERLFGEEYLQYKEKVRRWL